MLKKLSSQEYKILIEKNTEMPFSGIYCDHFVSGIYVCKQCESPLFSSESKFYSHCGWPSFDDEISQAVKKILDKDGKRTEIVCANCGGHLGHIFYGENFTKKNQRYCVNSLSLSFCNKIQKDKY
jgi:methionine-R-sulfoxide reductase